jgi:hypothetical protein
MEKIFEAKEFHGDVTFFGDMYVVQPSGGTILFNSAIASQYFSALDSTFSITSVDGALAPAGLNFASTLMIGWSSTANWWQAKDLGIARNGAGILEVNDGTAGSLADLTLSNIQIGGIITNEESNVALSDPPTQAEMVAGLGTAVAGDGHWRIVKSSANVRYLVFSDGTNWWYNTFTVGA